MSLCNIVSNIVISFFHVKLLGMNVNNVNFMKLDMFCKNINVAYEISCYGLIAIFITVPCLLVGAELYPVFLIPILISVLVSGHCSKQLGNTMTFF